MGELTIRETQAVELEILKYFHDVCRRHGLTYYLAYGTLIGAIRHRGFIPWDDDIDVLMPREDYRRLVEILRREPHGYYRLVSAQTEPGFIATLPKIIDSRTWLDQDYGFREKVRLGVYIDIFLLDGVGETMEEARANYAASYAIYRRWVRSALRMFPPRRNRLKSFAHWVLNLPCQIRGPRHYLALQEAQNAKLSFYKSAFVSDMTLGMPVAEEYIWPREWFAQTVTVPFEDTEFCAMSGYDPFLRRVYGDYMTPPPAEKQVTHHNYTAGWKAQENVTK